MANSPRNPDEVMDSLVETVSSLNPRINLRIGGFAVHSFAIANEISKLEEFASYLQSLYNISEESDIDFDDLANIALAFGKDIDVGRPARIPITLFRRERPLPGETLTVPIGTTVSDEEGRYVFSTINEVRMFGDYADVYYNAEENRYEITTVAEAQNVGADYNLPPYTVTKLLTSVENFDGCVNKRDPVREGKDPVDALQGIRIVQDSLLGINRDLTGSIISVLDEVDPTGYEDVAFVPSSDFNRFERNKHLQGRLGYDVYIISNDLEFVVQEGVASGGETKIHLDKVPAAAVEYVNVNGVPVQYSFNIDQDPALKGSPEGTYEVVLNSPLLPMQTYQIGYYLYSFIWEANNAVKNIVAPFGTDILVRRADPVEVLIRGTMVTSGTSENTDVAFELQSFAERYLRDPENINSGRQKFIGSLDPSDFVNNAISFVTGLQDLRLTTFIRVDYAKLPVETIYFDGATEYPILSPNFSVK